MQRRALVALFQRVLEASPALALILERIVAADHAVDVGVRVMAEPSADAAALDDGYLLLSHTAGSMAGPP